MHTDAQRLTGLLRLRGTGAPIYVQLRDQILQALGAGVLPPGAQMPTMRQVAVALKIDLNTVRHAYDELERLGALVLVRGRGSFVAEAAPAVAPDLSPLESLARQTLATARAARIDPIALADRIAALNTEVLNTEVLNTDPETQA